MECPITLAVDGESCTVTVDTRTSLLDALRDHLDVTAPKKGCDRGQCGACTVLLDGRRATTCLTLAVANDGAEVVTARGLTDGDELHPMQQAFLDQDGFQCGFCTPGQVCSAVGMLDEMRSGQPSYVTADLGQTGTGDTAPAADITDEEIRERMSGNLCRCAAYVNIVAAIRQAAGA